MKNIVLVLVFVCASSAIKAQNNSETESYIKSVEEKTGNAGEVTDIDGNVYKTVKIGDQIWMAQNLKTTRFDNGTAIPTITKGLDKLKKATQPVYQWAYDNDEKNVEYFGRLYTGWTIKKGNVCPSGWHVPDETEWNTLIDYLGGTEVAGRKLKLASDKLWMDTENATDEVWFKASGAGMQDFGFKELKITSTSYTSSGSAWYLITTYGTSIEYRNFDTNG